MDKEEQLNKEDLYCPICGGCGYIGCDGIRAFLKKHVVGKTDCLNEEIFVAKIIEEIEAAYDSTKAK